MGLTQNSLRLWKQKKYSPLYKSIDLPDIIYHLFDILQFIIINICIELWINYN